MQLDDRSLDITFREAHTHSVWLDKPVSDALIHQIYDLMKWAPTSANSSPARIVFVRGAAAFAAGHGAGQFEQDPHRTGHRHHRA